MAQGWISLNRELMNHWVWDCEFSAGQAWVDLLLYANHSPAKIMLKGQLLNINRGQQARSELTLSKSWRWSRNKVRRFLKNLEKDSGRDTNNNGNNGNNENKKNSRFKKPTDEELISYFNEYCSSGDFDVKFGEHQRFYDFYESKNWYVGKNKMKDWKASVRNWLSKHKKDPVKKQHRPKAFGE